MGSVFWDVVEGPFLLKRVPPPVVYTLGTSTRKLQEFVEILDWYAIVRVVDVRRFPTSRLDHFIRENLETALTARGLQYVYLGDDLGGYRKGGYEAYMGSHEFKRGIKALISVATKGTTAFVCAERLPWKCHRRFIGTVLQKKGWHVVHLIERDRFWTGKEGGKRNRLQRFQKDW